METGKTNKDRNKDFVPRSEFEAFKKSLKDASLKYNQQSPEYKRAMDRTMDEILPPKIIDIVWDRYFYNFDIFPSMESVSDLSDGIGSVTIVGGYIILETGNVANDTTFAYRAFDSRSILDFGKKQRFRTDLSVSVPATGTTAYIVVGDVNGSFYGFKLHSNGALYGISSNDQSEQTEVKLLDSFPSSTYTLEARLDPINKTIVFLINDVEKGTISTHLPKENEIDKSFIRMWWFQITTSDTTQRTLYGTFFEYIQER